MTLKIISPRGDVFEGEVQRVSLPGTKSPFVVLRNHAPLISSLTKGKVVFSLADGTSQEVAIEGGFVEVKSNEVVVCTE